MEDKEWAYLLVIVAVIIGGFYFVSAAKPLLPAIYILQNATGAAIEHNTISVTGTAEERLNPDMIVVSFNVEAEDASAKDAQSANAENVNAITAALKAMGIKDEDIKTTYYGVNEKTESHYVCKNITDGSDCYWTYTHVGFAATHSLAVNVYAMDTGGEAVDTIVENGGKVGSINFDLKPETLEAAKKRLLSAAGAAAKAKAESIAAGGGATVLRPLSFSEQYSYYPTNVYRDYAMEAAAPSGGTEISPGTMDVSVSVYAVFEIQ